MHLKGKYPLKKNSDIKQMYHDRYSGFIFEDEWIDIVRYMYNDPDADILIQIIGEFIQENEVNRQQPSARGRKASARSSSRDQDKKRGKLMFQDFLRILLEFQLRGHEKFLNPFVALFQKVDEEGNGIITESQFRKLVVDLNIVATPEDVERLLRVVDPFQTGVVIFSECVAAFTGDICQQEGQVSILQSLASREL